MSTSHFHRAAARLDDLGGALARLDDEASEMCHDLARVLREPDHRAVWVTDEMLRPVADALVGPETDPAGGE